MASESTAATTSLREWESELERVGPYHLKTWIKYLDHLEGSSSISSSSSSVSVIAETFDRALGHLPGSYKLWRRYLRWAQTTQTQDYESLFSRCLSTGGMHKYPVIWTTYLRHLAQTPTTTITTLRRTFDRALRSLPVTQHSRHVWPLYLDFAQHRATPTPTSLRVYRRYLKLHPTHKEEFVEFCRSRGLHAEACAALAECVGDPNFVSLRGKTRHQLWLELVELVTRHPDATGDLNVPAVLRRGASPAGLLSGRLYVALADYYIRRSHFALARDTYAEALGRVASVRDFSLVFDAYAQFLESLISALLARDGGEGQDDPGAAEDLDLLMEVLESLVHRRPLLLNACLLRQNVNSVHEWLKRAKLAEELESPESAARVFAEAVKTVKTSTSGYHRLWVGFALLYESNSAAEDCGRIFERAVVALPSCDALWLAYAEAEIRAGRHAEALAVLRRAASSCPKSLSVHALLADLTESLSGLGDDLRGVYAAMIDRKIATPQTFLNYAAILEEHRYFEDAFRVYETGCHAFRPPHASPIWRTYLAKFVGRYAGKKVERARDLFRSAIAEHDHRDAGLYEQYASFEEAHGLAKNVMAIYDAGVRSCGPGDKLALLESWVSKAKAFYGVSRMRQIYQAAVEGEPPEGLRDADVREVCLRYARLERGLGEVDRARAILRHGSQLANPKDPSGRAYWDEWNKFEVDHGNEDTFREMLRIKRSVLAFYSQANQHATTAAAAAAATGERGGAAADEMAALEAEVEGQNGAAAGDQARIPGFVKAETINNNPDEGGAAGTEEQNNPEDIDLDLDDDDGGDAGVEEGGGEEGVRQKAIPEGVFGSLKRKEGASDEKPTFVGAAERFKRARQGGE